MRTRGTDRPLFASTALPAQAFAIFLLVAATCVSSAQDRPRLPNPAGSSAEKVIAPPATQKEADEAFAFCEKGAKRPGVSAGYMRLCISGWMESINLEAWDNCMASEGNARVCFDRTFKF